MQYKIGGEQYLYEVTFEEWKKILKELIKKQEEEMIYCLMKVQMGNAIEKQYYGSLHKNLERSLINNMALLEMGEKQKDETIFYISSEGYPVKMHIGKTQMKKHKAIKEHITMLYS